MDPKSEAAVNRYVSAAIVHGECSETSDYRRGNRAHDDILANLKVLREAGEDGTASLIRLLEHTNDSVRVWAATHLLNVDNKKATRVLKRVAKGDGLVAFSAEMVLQEWRKGTLGDPLSDDAKELECLDDEGSPMIARSVNDAKPTQVDDIIEFVAKLPMQIPLQDVTEIDHLSERVGLATSASGDFFGFGQDFVELCPDDDERPSMAVRLAWAWVVRPDLDEQITPHANKTLRDSMTYYRS